MNPPPAPRARLLVVDDSVPHLRILARGLEEAGFEVQTAESGEAALAAALASPPDLVLLDVGLPGLDGYETCRLIHQQAQFASTPVIFISGLAEVADKMAAFAAGGADYVTKPFQLEEVRARITAHLELARLRREAELHAQTLDTSLAKLRELERFRHDLVHMVAHDMRSPLMAVTGYLELLDLDHDRLGEDQREFVDQALDGARTLVRLIDSMLDTDRLETGKLPLQLADRDLRAILDLAVASLGPGNAHRFAIEARTPGRMVVHADGEILRRVIANLLANALRNSSEEERIRVVASSTADIVRLEILDRGARIPEEFRARVFEKYASRSGDRDRRSVGLGLPFCRLAIEAHGGHIGFVTGEDDTTFWIELPAHAPR